MRKILHLFTGILRSSVRLALDLCIVLVYGWITAICFGIKRIFVHFAAPHFALKKLQRAEIQNLVFGELLRDVLTKCDSRDLLNVRLVSKSWCEEATRVLHDKTTNRTGDRIGFHFEYCVLSGTFHGTCTFNFSQLSYEKDERNPWNCPLKDLNSYFRNTFSPTTIDDNQGVEQKQNQSFPALSFCFENLRAESLNSEEFRTFSRLFGRYVRELSLDYLIRYWGEPAESGSARFAQTLAQLSGQFPNMEILDIRVFPGWAKEEEEVGGPNTTIVPILSSPLHRLHTIMFGRTRHETPAQAVTDETREFFYWAGQSCPNIRLIEIRNLTSLAHLLILPFPAGFEYPSVSGLSGSLAPQVWVKMKSFARTWIEMNNLQLDIFEEPIELLEELVKGKFYTSNFWENVHDLTIIMHLGELENPNLTTCPRRIEILLEILSKCQGPQLRLTFKGSALFVLAQVLPFSLPNVYCIGATDRDNFESRIPPINVDTFMARFNIPKPALLDQQEFYQLFPSLSEIRLESATEEYFRQFLDLFRDGAMWYVKKLIMVHFHPEPPIFSFLLPCLPWLEDLEINFVDNVLLDFHTFWGFSKLKTVRLDIIHPVDGDGNGGGHLNFYPKLDAALSSIDSETVERLSRKMLEVMMQEEESGANIQSQMEEIELEIRQARKHPSILDLQELERLELHFVAPYRWDVTKEVPFLLSKVTDQFTLQKMTTFPNFRLVVAVDYFKYSADAEELGLWNKMLTPIKGFPSIELKIRE